MGFLICALLWGVVLISEIERTPDSEWRSESALKIFQLKRTRRNIAFLLALAVGAFFLAFEISITLSGRSTLNVIQAIGLLGVLFGCLLYAVSKKGK